MKEKGDPGKGLLSMRKEYGIGAYGEITNLLADLEKIADIKIGHSDTYISVRIDEKKKERYPEVKELFIKWCAQDHFIFSDYFRANDLTRQDYEAAEAIEAFFPVFGESGSGRIRIKNTGATIVRTCPKCNGESVSWDGAGLLILSAAKPFSYPAFTSNFNCSVLREDVLEELTKQNLTGNLLIKECEIKTEATIKDRYYVIFPRTDLGIPVGDMEFSEKCADCHRLELAAKREFLFSYDRKKFAKHHFARTSWRPYGCLIISQPVYKVLSRIPELAKKHLAKPDEEIFKIVGLSDVEG